MVMVGHTRSGFIQRLSEPIAWRNSSITGSNSDSSTSIGDLR